MVGFKLLLQSTSSFLSPFQGKWWLLLKMISRNCLMSLEACLTNNEEFLNFWGLRLLTKSQNLLSLPIDMCDGGLEHTSFVCTYTPVVELVITQERIEIKSVLIQKSGICVLLYFEFAVKSASRSWKELKVCETVMIKIRLEFYCNMSRISDSNLNEMYFFNMINFHELFRLIWKRGHAIGFNLSLQLRFQHLLVEFEQLNWVWKM